MRIYKIPHTGDPFDLTPVLVVVASVPATNLVVSAAGVLRGLQS
jgi:hypothetical protein